MAAAYLPCELSLQTVVSLTFTADFKKKKDSSGGSALYFFKQILYHVLFFMFQKVDT